MSTKKTYLNETVLLNTKNLMFKLIVKKIITILHSIFLLIWTNDYMLYVILIFNQVQLHDAIYYHGLNNKKNSEDPD